MIKLARFKGLLVLIESLSILSFRCVTDKRVYRQIDIQTDTYGIRINKITKIIIALCDDNEV